ncbi:DUF3037 domain-containing protein [Nocardioides sp. TRM66260-LWL]|uniref:DUF3037 domain-containing protein n=1 Tax=Nocardioides sp. TRM66260-LWL TaxID=2874478 RepID=UPI001CC6E4E9|nr:DUF3037 domain-containing protein [Nocardioides sp. TRM66260-LWL]MBZ5733782.1 DUF3037 domain-containing protein [Nocardioides sp. TRM66260-LWL]
MTAVDPASPAGVVTRHPYQYVVLRCVPRVEREEFVNVGVVVFCHATDHLVVAWHLDEHRLSALAPGLELGQVRAALDFVDAVCAADPRAGAVAGEPVSRRFGFLKAPRSTVLQPGPVHGGLSERPDGEARRLLARLVLPDAPRAQTGTSSTAPTA